MIDLLAGAVVAVAFAAHEGSASCTLNNYPGVRARNAMELTLRATPDSVPDVRGVSPGADEFSHRRRFRRQATLVHGQVFEIVQVHRDLGGEPLRGHTRAVLIWWQLGAFCDRGMPLRSVHHELSEVFVPAQRARSDGVGSHTIVVELRPDSLWIEGVPTFDVTDGAWIYAYTEPGAGDPPSRGEPPLTIPEYRDFYLQLPEEGMSSTEYEASRRRLLRWGEADLRRWTRQPAARELCLAAWMVDPTLGTARGCKR